MKIMAMEIEEYRTLLEQMSMPTVSELSVAFVAFVVILWLLCRR